ncbi:putative protein N(5)-glutamine methyltransferase [Brevibacillus sp. M2.1A]|uniref:putative protein N(5)-glutamine methyltransferase n=1 Tax=Brevibacillus TaxID=55080 RepID=UPI00156B8A47|nr:MULTISPECIES: putative protein N(5)-glutamine methyltransferase [Brevibacillus]MBY0087724.1 putative protein N(5)-glutamine methyltransferase [Brevibacillus brevis]MCC8436774.1 putative protein N(5)-glutamine methyltransferase [Brevibacillus sp. M2.1A]MCE0448765.1 putative protein N(5)-glutamine methyltransferase [Brevibacillus sp. AF8]UKK98949.1 putative protein N(5)-glutamine methyltransferase [Brevibacillus brevis]
MKNDWIHGEQFFSTIVTKLQGAGCVFAEDEARLLIASAEGTAELSDMVEQRTSGMPLEHIIGWAEFCGLRITVDKGVFVPRQRTAFLVRQATDLIRQKSVVLDLCCGSGAVGAVLAHIKQIELYATDIDPASVQCTRRNIITADGHVYEGDLFEPLPKILTGRVDVIVANAPYVPTKSIEFLPPEARMHEARIALDGGSDGLDVQRRVVAAAPLWLAPGGHLLVETSERQTPQTVAIFTRCGLKTRVTRSDELDATVVIGTKTTP